MALYSNSNDRILRKSMISVMTETTISCLKSGQKEKKTPLLLTKNLLLPLLSVNVIFFRLSVFELWIFCHGGKTQQFKVPVSSSNADAEGECYSKQIIHFSNLECLNKISLTESWGSSSFFVYFIKIIHFLSRSIWYTIHSITFFVPLFLPFFHTV